MRSIRLILFPALFPLFILLAGSSSIQKIPAVGELAGQRIRTTVDSELAQYYLESYLSNKRTRPQLDSLIDQIHHDTSNADLPTREYFKHLAHTFSPDFATLYLARRILQDQANQSVQAAYREEYLQLKNTSVLKPHKEFSSYIILVIPGWVYKSHPETGASLARPREVLAQLGLEVHLLEITESGTIEQNADFISQEILRYHRLGKKIILVSASSGSASVALALGQRLSSEDASQIAAWLNIGGLLQGSPLADAAVRGPKRWLVKFVTLFKGWDFASIESMTTRRSRERFRHFKLPKDFLVINYIGIPMSGDVTKLAKDGYEDLRREGPSDGLTLITDEIFPGGITVVELGLDHYFQDEEIDLKTAALAQTVINYLETEKREINQSSSQ